MATIELRMGRSTVLKFQERPNRAIIGNQNYYHLEYVKGTNAVTLQPQGPVETNLFICIGTKVYGFILKGKEKGSYDDLVKISWKKEKPRKFSRKKMNLSTSLGGLKINLRSLKRLYKNIYILDGEVLNIYNGPISLKGLSIRAYQRKDLEFFTLKENLLFQDRTPLRLFVFFKKRENLTLRFSWYHSHSTLILPNEWFF